MNYYPDFFNDVFGPIMQPGSSSHTAAPCRLGLLARSLLGEKPKSVNFIMDKDGSFAGTFGVMNEDKGMLAGILGIGPEEERINSVYDLANKDNITYQFIFDVMKESEHLNAIKFSIKGESGKYAELVGDSIGGGMVRVRRINGFDVSLLGDTFVLLIFSNLSENQINAVESSIEGFIERQLIKSEKGSLILIKSSISPNMDVISDILLGVKFELLKPILPVTMSKFRKPQLFNSIGEWNSISKQLGVSMSEVAIRYEMDSSLWTRAQVYQYMLELKEILYNEINAAYQYTNREKKPFYRYDGGKWLDYEKKGKVLSGGIMGQVIKRSIGVNSKTKGIPIVPGPMGTGGGYLFSALYSIKEEHNFNDEDLIRALFVAAGVGAIAYTHTNPTGEVVGCGGECGVCCAMGAAALVEMADGNGEQIENAASLALQAFIGLPCDPVIGGYESPCFSRVVTASCMSVIYADLALAGSKAVIPYDEVLDALNTLGKGMSTDLLCTSKGGICVTPTAKKCEERFKYWLNNR